MADQQGRKMIQTVLNLYPQQRKAISGARSPYFSRPTRSPPAYSRKESDDSQEMEDVQSTCLGSSRGQETTNSSFSNTQSQSSHTAVRSTRDILADVAEETTLLLPNILATAPHAPPKGFLYSPPKPPFLNRKYCPGFPATAVRIVDEDTLNAAIGLAQCAKYITVRDRRPVCVLNMANAYSAGGGWKKGALAQEEALCYRSSLSFTLKRRYYPLPELGAIYSPTVLVIRSSLKDSHALLDLNHPEKLPVVSVISVAALCFPETTTSSDGQHREIYKNLEDRDITKEKMRLILRTAAFNGHRRLVLGALGCGAFLNPKEEVADCWAEVFGEREFGGGWRESIIFAVLNDIGHGKDGDGNFDIFFQRLNGMMV